MSAQTDAVRTASKNVPPVDDAVKIPESVRRAAEKANSYYRAAPADGQVTLAAPAEPVVPVREPAATEPAITPVAAPVQEPAVEPPATPPVVPQAPAEPVAPEQWEHRYNSMKGRYDQAQQTIGAMQEQMQEIGNELIRTQKLLNVQPHTPAPAVTPLVTDKDRADYGDGIIDLIHRVAADTVAPQLSTMEQQNKQTNQQLVQDRRQLMYTALDGHVPNWEEINRRPEFKQWLRLRDIYSGKVRQEMLNEAFRAADAPRVANFFKGFITDEATTTGATAPVLQPQAPAPAPRQAAIPLETLTAPGRARPATGDTQVPADKPIFTHAQIAWFYDQVRRGGYNGREAEKAKDEAAIFAAQREGRIR
jgi:hypothetical protein